jgi:rRNA-processing protein FCF1
MIKVILDTNFLIYCAENKIDYVHEITQLMDEGHELVVPQQVENELNELYKKGEKFSDRQAAWLALKLIKANNVQIIRVPGRYADEAIINLMRVGNIVATLDLELRKRLRNSRVIVIQGKKKLAFD